MICPASEFEKPLKVEVFSVLVSSGVHKEALLFLYKLWHAVHMCSQQWLQKKYCKWKTKYYVLSQQREEIKMSENAIEWMSICNCRKISSKVRWLIFFSLFLYKYPLFLIALNPGYNSPVHLVWGLRKFALD